MPGRRPKTGDGYRHYGAASYAGNTACGIEARTVNVSTITDGRGSRKITCPRCQQAIARQKEEAG